MNPRPKPKWLTGTTIVSPLFVLLPLTLRIPEVQIAVPLILFVMTLLMYKPVEKSLPELHPYVLHKIQRLEEMLSEDSYAILLFDGGTDAKGLQTFLLNYQMILDPKTAPLFILEPKNEPTTIRCHPKDLVTTEGTSGIDPRSWGSFAKDNGWAVGHVRGDFDAEILSPVLEQWKINLELEQSTEVENE